MINENIIKQIKDYAELNNVPIMMDDSMSYIMKYIKDNHVKSILEVGTAIGYSAIMMCSVDPNVFITTIERDEKRYLEALKNIKNLELEDRITLVFNDALNVEFDEEFEIYNDALEVKVEDNYDLIIIDAAKAQNQKFFERFEKNLNPYGTIITDNMGFHGLVMQESDEIKSRNLRQLVRKVKDYKEFLEKNIRYETTFLDIGDGLAISRKL